MQAVKGLALEWLLGVLLCWRDFDLFGTFCLKNIEAEEGLDWRRCMTSSPLWCVRGCVLYGWLEVSPTAGTHANGIHERLLNPKIP
jgi:hypothetical protein